MFQEENNSFDSSLTKKNASTENLIFINQLFLRSSSAGTWYVTIIVSEMWLWNLAASWTNGPSDKQFLNSESFNLL